MLNKSEEDKVILSLNENDENFKMNENQQKEWEKFLIELDNTPFPDYSDDSQEDFSRHY